MDICAELESSYDRNFPSLKTADHSKTSECDEKYNCIAWIFGAQDRKWWPVDADEAYWPRELNNKLTILQEFILLLEDAGFEKC
ncbi:MAG TPA: hypothetical protein VJ044_02355, partial [Candidatus Hodarchaeales archaeon]|nr:hypothetical protein [Candidatus Hodarchaeales archaeon]